ncbi:hypothetical protein [Streptomyces sp. NPDC021356]|uniref:hypothetical protein n=1 Tax=Streptomyces sp. NPDC021356 TaxID=3154900 RepID=UPI0033DF7F6A
MVMKNHPPQSEADAVALASSCGARRSTSRVRCWFKLIDLRGELFDALGEHAQRHVGGLGHRVLGSPTVGWAEARAGAVQLGVAEAGQPFPQSRRPCRSFGPAAV